MAGGGRQRRYGKPSIGHSYNLFQGALFDLPSEDFPQISSGKVKQGRKNSEVEPPHLLSTRELISAVGHVWNSSILGCRCSNGGAFEKGITLCCPVGEKSCGSSTCATDVEYIPVKLASIKDFSTASSKGPKCCEKIAVFEPCIGSYPLWKFDFLSIVRRAPLSGLGGTVLPYDLRHVHGWTSGIKHSENSAAITSNETNECNFGDVASKSVSSVRTDSTDTPVDSLLPENAETANLLSIQNENTDSGARAYAMVKCSELRSELNQDERENSLNNPNSALLTDSVDILASSDCACEVSEKRTDSNFREHGKSQGKMPDMEENSKEQICMLSNEKSHHALARQEHAFAGAMAGIFVSLCLHPMDTIKTVVQSYRTNQKSLHFIGRSIISERGLTGLYRGIASNIASSAPISAIYTFTYESVKGTLLPFFPKDNQSLAHCVAGGCASVATSFIFTPSEHIKQQMQIGSHYRNCWNALVGILKKGGITSLYAGWAAVLCRNVPHSIVKFYTYESLKQLMFSPGHGQATTLMTLVCGGVAGSTAAFFTTPFDVVKTRVQTQFPGSGNQYHGVFDTLRDIRKHEGLNGLYRGLTPRLVMYMTQGALFFASYESFKRLFSLELPKQ